MTTIEPNDLYSLLNCIECAGINLSNYPILEREFYKLWNKYMVGPNI